MSIKNDEADITEELDDNDGCIQKHHYMKSVMELNTTNKQLSSDFQLMQQHMIEMEAALKALQEEVEALKAKENLSVSKAEEVIKKPKHRHVSVSFNLQAAEESSRRDDDEVDVSIVKDRTYSTYGDDMKKSVYYDRASHNGEDDVLGEIIERISMKERDLHYLFLPSDTYSYFAVSDYFTRDDYCPMPARAFTIACFTLLIQIVTLSIFIMDVVDYKNKTNPISVPPGVGAQVRVSQLIALLISCWNQDEMRASFNVLSLGYKQEKVSAINYYATRHKWYASILIRIFLGSFSLIVTFILIVNSDTVRDVMLDFAAVTFVSELDNGVFQLSLWGYMGADLQQLAMKITKIPVHENTVAQERKKKKIPRLVWLLIVIGLVIGCWSWVTIKQEHGGFMDQSVFVQFGDDFSPALAAFSGVYEIELDDTLDGMRVNYVERGPNSEGRFSYCSQDRRWLFQYGEEPEDYDGSSLFSECWHKARSAQTESFDLTETSSITWFVVDEELESLEHPLQHFLVKGQNDFYGKSCTSDEECGERMYCSESDNKCVCDDGLFGINCEFREPCRILEIDSRDLNGFFGTRSWSRRYSSLLEDNGNGESKSSSPIQVYGKPVYVGDESIEGIIDVMIFTGRRWILTDSVSIEDYDNNNSNETTSSSSLSPNNGDDDGSNMNAKRNLAEFLSNNFHAYWSNYTFHFASEPVDVGTPTDSATPVGLQWFRLESIGTQGASLGSGDQFWQGRMSIEANLLCAVCDNETNPCFYEATCQADGACNCTTGSSGRLCQIPPDNDGNCDVFFNTPEFGFDGGDCCQETCTSTDTYICGNAMLENAAGIYAYGFVGYPNCQDPRFKSRLSGSTTLYEIVERGFVRCGNAKHEPGFFEITEDGILSGFEVDLCKSVAAAALGDPDAIEMVLTSWGGRWNDLVEGKFDVLLSRTTHTAERDIFQSNARTGFSFARIPEFFDGLRYGGIPPYVECADNLDFESPECLNLRICVTGGNTWYTTTERLFPDSIIVAVENGQAGVNLLETGVCNVVAGESIYITEPGARERGFTGPSYKLGSSVYSKEPLTGVTRQDDRVFSKFVSGVFEALIQAEESGVTKSTAEADIAQTDLFGEPFENMFKNAVAANGNFGEIYAKNLEDRIPRGGLNTINTGGSGLMYSFPFGAIDTVGEGPLVGGTLDTIRKRGILNCGIATGTGRASVDPETGVWKGFEVDMCRGIAAALFNGSPNVNFISLTSADRFAALADGTVDVMNCGTTHTLTREIKEVTTGQGFDFTPPTFYDGLSFAGRPPFVACAEVRMFDDNEEEHCSNTKICVADRTTTLETVIGPLGIPAENVVVAVNTDDVHNKFVVGECNVIAGESLQIMRSSVTAFGLSEDEEYVVGAFKYAKEPLAIVSRSDDAQFSDFLRWIVFGFFHAEEAGITREDYYNMQGGNYLFGSALSNMWQYAIEAVGNYGEIYARNYEGILERGGPNTLNDNNGPQFLAMPGVMINNQ